MNALAQVLPDTLEVNGKMIELNEDGHLINYEDWNEEVAKILAAQDGLELQECHWETIHFLRNYYQEYEIPPSPRMVIKTVGERLTGGKCSRKDLEQLFPLGGCKHACRLSGLPEPYCRGC